jgi:hypothetical protein
MKYGVCERNCSDEGLATTTAFLAEMGSGIILLDAYSMRTSMRRLSLQLL